MEKHLDEFRPAHCKHKFKTQKTYEVVKIEKKGKIIYKDKLIKVSRCVHCNIDKEQT